MDNNCQAKVTINSEELFVEEAHGVHSCPSTLKMDVDYGMLDGYLFLKHSGEGDGTKIKWYCEYKGCKGETKGCKIMTTGNELKLAYPHTKNMHKCDGHF